MPAFLVELPESATVSNLGGAADKMIVFAANADGARRGAAGRFDGEGNALWLTLASVTEIVVSTALADSGDGWSAYCRISGGVAQTVDPFIATADGKSKNQAQGNLGAVRISLDGALNDGGTATYIIDDILTAVGGTFVRAATFRVITVNTGVILTIELVDPGEYSVLPPVMTANPVSGGGGTLALVDLTEFASNSYEAIMAQMVTEILANPDIDDTALDLSEGALGARLLTVSSISDGIGEATLEFELRNNGLAEPVLVSTIVHEDTAAAVLTMAIPAIPILPPRVIPVKS